MAEAAARAWGFTPDSVLAGAQGGAVPAAESGLWADMVECQSGGWPLSASIDKPADSRDAIGSRYRRKTLCRPSSSHFLCCMCQRQSSVMQILERS